MATRLSIICGLAAALFLGTAAPSKADSPSGWTVIGPEHHFDKNTNDGRTFTFGFADVRHQSGASGVLMSVYRPARPPVRMVVPADRLGEFTKPLAVRAYGKSWLGDQLGAVSDLGGVFSHLWHVGENFIRGVQNDLKNVQKEFKELVAAIMRVFDRFSGLFAGELNDTSGGEAVAKYAVAVRDVNAFTNQPLAWRVQEAMRRTLAQDNSGGRWTIDLAQVIIDY